MSPYEPQVAPYGSWSSPVTAASLSADTVMIMEPHLDGPDVYWAEARPADGGRVVVVRRTADGRIEDVAGAPYNVRSRVHEYGGGSYDVRDGVLVFCNLDDRRVYRVDLGADGDGAQARPITPAEDLRYGDLRISPSGRWLIAVCEDHGTGADQPANRLVRLDPDADNVEGGVVLVEGPDFVAAGALSRDERRLAWLQWDHPNMPWDGTELCVAELDSDGRLSGSRVVAGGLTESVSQPTWAPDGRLVFTSDRTGWWNLYACDVTALTSEVEALWPAEHEFADAQGQLGMSSYGISPDGLLVARWLDEGYAKLGMLDLNTGTRTPLDLDATAVQTVVVTDRSALLLAWYADRPMALTRLELAAPESVKVFRESSSARIDPGLVSVCESVTWSAPDGDLVHGYYNAPLNPAYAGPAGELPPLLVMSHGGPTAMSPPVYDPRLQFWTTRGFAVLTVNYRGSSGFGRAYRERLRGQWGVVDVDDCASGAQAMVAMGRADPQRLAIRGGSAGGYTTLAALTFRDVFTAGASLFGIGDLETLARDTHKFESRYLDGLIGPYPERRDLYRERSPINHVEQIRCPMILLQGREDQVVPLNQAESMAAAVRANGLPVALLIFDGEGHGFRRAENQIRAIEAEAYFYSRVFGFALADDVEPVEIENLPPRS